MDLTPTEGLYLKQIEVGPMANFVYLIGDAKTREVLLVDPAWQMDTLFKVIEQENLKLAGALITHCHFDHCNAVDEMLAKADVPVYIHKEEAAFSKSMSGENELFGSFPEEHLKKVENGDQLKVGNVEISFLHTPGHTPGSQCFLVKNNLVAGDTLFIKGCGRTDLPGGDPKKMYESLTQKLMKLPDETVLYPGHFYGRNPTSLFSEEKKKNPYFLSGSYETFLSLAG
jgi:hydroxyacylglutathione hydrolase